LQEVLNGAFYEFFQCNETKDFISKSSTVDDFLSMPIHFEKYGEVRLELNDVSTLASITVKPSA
jgi:hypothetical protein